MTLLPWKAIAKLPLTSVAQHMVLTCISANAYVGEYFFPSVFSASLAVLCGLTHPSEDCRGAGATYIQCDVHITAGVYSLAGARPYIYLCDDDSRLENKTKVNSSQPLFAGLFFRLALTLSCSSVGLMLLSVSQKTLSVCLQSWTMEKVDFYFLGWCAPLGCEIHSACISKHLPPTSFKAFKRPEKIHLVNSLLCSSLDFNIYLLIQSNIWRMPRGEKISHYENQKGFFPPSPLQRDSWVKSHRGSGRLYAVYSTRVHRQLL